MPEPFTEAVRGEPSTVDTTQVKVRSPAFQDSADGRNQDTRSAESSTAVPT